MPRQRSFSSRSTHHESKSAASHSSSTEPLFSSNRHRHTHHLPRISHQSQDPVQLPLQSANLSLVNSSANLLPEAYPSGEGAADELEYSKGNSGIRVNSGFESRHRRLENCVVLSNLQSDVPSYVLDLRAEDTEVQHVIVSTWRGTFPLFAG